MNKAAHRRPQARARKRRLIAAGIGVVALAGVIAAYLVWSGDGAFDDDGAGTNAAERFTGGPNRFLYADFDDARDLHALDLDSGETEDLGELPRVGNTQAAPGSTWLSIEAPEEIDGTFKPVIYLFDVASGKEERVGIGVTPEWAQDGTRLAFLAPEDESRCNEEDCRGPLRPMVLDINSLEASELTAPGVYDIRNWAGDHLLLDNEDTPGAPILRIVSPAGEMEDLPIQTKDLWDASPDGNFFVQSDATGTRFVALEDGRLGDAGPEIGIPEGTKLGHGAWSHDSSRVAALALSDDRELEMVTFSPSDPEPRPVTEGGRASTTQVLWSPENDAFVFTRLTGRELEAVHCSLDGTCETLLSWTRGIAPLRVE